MSFDTLLVATVLTPASLLGDLKARFKTVHYVPLPPIAPNGSFPEGTIFPTEEQVASADVILSLFLPPSLTSITQAPRLRLFQAISAGYAHLTSTPFFQSLPEDHPLIFASASGIHVSAIGEHVIATTLSLYHRLNEIQLKIHQGKWFIAQVDFGGLFVRTLRGQTVGIVGSGYIVPNTGDAAGDIPIAYYSSSSPSSVAAFMAVCDVVVNTLPSAAGNKHFIGETELKAMKGDSVVVNIGRGDTIDTEAITAALTAQTPAGEDAAATGTLRIGGASLDVTDPEPLPDGHALFTLPNVILTPHMSGLSKEYFVLATDLLLQNVERVQAGKGAFNAFRGKGEE
ncbi:hypothetical protein RQP46_001281 [Phenoliferia psychrophenolica]